MTRRKARRIRLKKKRIVFLAAALFLMILVVAGLRIISLLNSLTSRESWALELSPGNQGERVNFMVAGIDYLEDGQSFADQVVLISFMPEEEGISVLYFPGNTYVNIKDYGRERLGRVYTLESAERRASLLIDMVSEIVGLPVHYFIELHYSGISEIVNLLKEINLDVEKAVIKENRIIFQQGRHALKGDEAYKYFTLRSDDEDYLDRLERQRLFLGMMITEIKKKNLPVLAGIIGEMSPYIQTNLKWREIVYYHDLFHKIDFKKEAVLEIIPGRSRRIDGADVWLVDEEKYRTVIKKLFMKTEIKDEVPVTGNIKIEILNGTGETGIVSKTAEMLKERGYEIVRLGNADSFDYQKSQVISRIEDIEPAKSIAVLIPGADLLIEPVDDYEAQVTVIIGGDYE